MLKLIVDVLFETWIAQILIICGIFLVIRWGMAGGRGPRGKRRRGARGASPALARYAAERGLEVGDGDTLEIAEAARQVQAITGEPDWCLNRFLWNERASAESKIDRVLYGQDKLFMDTYWTSGTNSGRVIAARRAPHWPPFVVDDGKLVQGYVPLAVPGNLLAGLPEGSRLTSAAGWLTLSTSGDLTPELASELDRRLSTIP